MQNIWDVTNLPCPFLRQPVLGHRCRVGGRRTRGQVALPVTPLTSSGCHSWKCIAFFCDWGNNSPKAMETRPLPSGAHLRLMDGLRMSRSGRRARDTGIGGRLVDGLQCQQNDISVPNSDRHCDLCSRIYHVAQRNLIAIFPPIPFAVDSWTSFH